MQPELHGGPDGLERILERAVADDADHRPVAPRALLGQGQTGRRRHAPTQGAGSHDVVAVGLGDGAKRRLGELADVGGRFVDQDVVFRQVQGQGGKGLLGGEGLPDRAQDVRGRFMDKVRLAGPGRRAPGHLGRQGRKRQPAVADQAVADNGPGRFGRIVRDLEQFRPGRQVVARHPGVVAENRRADDHDQVMAGQGLAHRADGTRQRPGKQRMVLGKGHPFRERPEPDRGLEPFGQGEAFLPGVAAGHVAAVDQHRLAAGVDGGRKGGKPVRVRGLPGGDRTEGVLVGHFLVPVVQGQGHEHRTGRLLHGHGIGAHEGGGHVLRLGRLIAPFDQGPG